jgi:hypothetical protein
MAPVLAILGMVARSGQDDARFDPAGEIFQPNRHRAEPDQIRFAGSAI